jgi:hypothetical protein
VIRAIKAIKEPKAVKAKAVQLELKDFKEDKARRAFKEL